MAAATAVRSRPGKQQQILSSMEIEESTPLQSTTTNHRTAADHFQPRCVQTASTISYALDVYSHPLVLESKTAFKALLIVPLVVWWCAVLSGMWAYEGLPKGQKVNHNMLWFDRGILRPAGPVLPFIVLVLRAFIHGADYVYRHGVTSSTATAKAAIQKAANRAAAKRPTLKLGSLLSWCLVIYVAMAVARAGIYLTHWFLLANRYLEYHIVSDHIFLAATMLICLHTEIICIMSDILRVHRQSESPRAALAAAAAAATPGLDILLSGLFVLAAFLFLFTAADMYYTARYYHFPLESGSTTLLTFLVFQLPMIVWLIRQRRFKALV